MSAKSKAQLKRWAKERAYLVEDVEWLLSFRTDNEEIAKRLGTNILALSRRLERAGRTDLSTKIDRVAIKKEREWR